MRLGFVRYIKYLIYPNVCPFCEEVIKPNEYICDKCNQDITYLDKNTCAVCKSGECECKNYGCSYDRAIIPCEYTRKAVKAIKRFKFYDCPSYAENFGELICDYIKASRIADNIDIVCSVPMTKKAMKKRGYNQSFLLSKNVSRLLGKPCENDTLIKIRSTKNQHSLNSRNRKFNLKGAFAVKDKEKIKGKAVLLVDDVVTTGATINECASTLIANGADRVYVSAVCKTKWLNIDKQKIKR